jgi:hypothetical protein
MAHPGGDREREVADRAAGAQLVPDRAEQPLRQLLRAVARDLRRAVADRGVGEALEQARLVAARSVATASVGATSSAIIRRMKARKSASCITSAMCSKPARPPR